MEEANMKAGGFKIRRIKVTENGVTYVTHQITGYLNGQRVRKKVKDRDEAAGEVNRLNVEAANSASGTRALNTRLTVEQLAEAEAAFAALAGKVTLSGAVEWYKANYRPDVEEKPLGEARDAFIADRTPHVSKCALRDYRHTLKDFIEAFPGRSVDSIKTPDVQGFLTARKVGPKRFNNLRGDLNAFFAFSVSPARKWAKENPVKPIAKFKILRGLPEIIDAKKAAELMAYVETFDGGARKKIKPGSLAPYFALCLFAGIRPSVPHGEAWKLGQRSDLERLINPALGVVNIPPEVSKVGELRQIKIRPNLAAWLARYPVKEFPVIIPNMQDLVTQIRKRFELGDDVLRHTFISNHVAKFRSLGDAALEAGNSESMIKRHYLNLMTEAEAEAFWAILPTAPAVEAKPAA